MPDPLEIKSHKGPYKVYFSETIDNIDARFGDHTHFLVDANISRLYKDRLRQILDHPKTIILEATEENKSIDRIIPVFEQLIKNQIHKDHILVGIGGGIIQDITCFIASILMRGINWKLMPTTLLAQADSCIGSKSSVNLGVSKNILGTFYPPSKIFICSEFLGTLEPKDINSGIGEMLKVHAIKGCESFDKISEDYDEMITNKATLLDYIYNSLLIKKDYIEKDEFDRSIRNIFNYGHSFGHAIETATNFSIPHGIAITMGMNIANFVSTSRGLMPSRHYTRMKPVLIKNAKEFLTTDIGIDDLWSALKKDKKNTSNQITLILPEGERAEIKKIGLPPDGNLFEICERALNEAFL